MKTKKHNLKILAFLTLAVVTFVSCKNGKIDEASRILFGLTERSEIGVTITREDELVTTEPGGTATFTVELNTRPSADVTIPTIASSDTTEGTVDKSSLTFTPENYNEPQTIPVTGANDNFVDGNINYDITLGNTQSDDSSYDGLSLTAVPAINMDDETAGVVVTPVVINLIEGFRIVCG